MKTPIVFRVYKKDQIFVVKQFVDDDRIVIGSGPDVHIDLGTEISPIHCIVEKRGEGFFICDMGSEKGTFRDKRLILDEPILNGDSFQVGAFSIVFFIGSQKNASTNLSAPPPTAFDHAPEVDPEPEMPKVAPPQPVAAKPDVVKPVMKPMVKPIVAPVLKAKSNLSVWAKRRQRNTFAPKSEFRDLKDHFKVGTGTYVEVIVSWQERIVNTYHFPVHGKKQLGVNSDISVPEGSAPKGFTLLNLDSVVTINTTPEMKVELLRDGELKVIKESELRLQQAEACFIQLINGMQLIIRFAPKPPVMIFESPLVLGASEFTGLLASLIIAVLAGLLVSVNKPKMDKIEDVEVLAKVVFTKPPVQLTEVELTEKTPVTPQPIPPEPVKQAVKIEEKSVENKTKASDSGGKVAEVKPKDTKIKAKMFTSTKQGGAVKTGSTDGANAKSKEPDPNNSGLLAAFGSGGARAKLDQAYSGAGELLGAGEKAKGASGFSSDRKGDDLGSKFKDTGAGGAGTATQGIAGVGTKGRSTGMNGYGSGTGFGDKDKVQISAGGGEESFVGSIDKEAVRRVIMAALSQFKSCYEREYRSNTKLEGKVVVAWEIHEQGVAKNARIVMEKSNIKNKLVEECVRTRMLGLVFPEPPPGTWADISFPFVFHGQKF